MLRGCLFALVLYAAIAVGYFYWLDTVFEPPGSYYGAAGLGFVVFCCLGALMNARTAWKDGSLAAAARSHTPPRDGQLFAACGTIQPIDKPLLAPFSNFPCCLVEYDLSQESKSSSNEDAKTGSDLAGFLMTPSEVDTGSGRYKVLGFPILEEGAEHRLSSFTAARRARDFVSRTTFEDISGLRLVNAFGAIQDAWMDEDGHVEKNLQLKKVDLQRLFPDDFEAVWQEVYGNKFEDEIDLAGTEEDEDDDDLNEVDGELVGQTVLLGDYPLPTLKEKRVAPGDQVCVIGKYDEIRRGIRPAGGGMKGIRLIRGNVDTLERKSRASLWSHLWGGLIFLLLAHGMTYGIMQLYLHSEDTARKRTSIAFRAAEQGDVAPIARLVKRGLDINARDSQKRTMLMVTREPAVAEWLIAQKIDVNAVDERGFSAMRWAVANHQPRIVELLIAAGAPLDVRDRAAREAWPEADEALNPTKEELVREAKDEPINITAENGKALPADGGPQLLVAKMYVRAIFDRNRGQLAAAQFDQPKGEIAESLWKDWQQNIFEPFEKFEGYERGNEATLNVFGRCVPFDNAPARMEFQMRRVGGEWKIVDKKLYIN